MLRLSGAAGREAAGARRDLRILKVHTTELVPDDAVVLVAGDRVPADLRLVLAAGCSVDESMLTGESEAVAKVAGWTPGAELPAAIPAVLVADWLYKIARHRRTGQAHTGHQGPKTLTPDGRAATGWVHE